MATMLNVKAKEKGSYTIPLSFVSAVTGATVIPETITWSLRTADGSIVNNRSDVSVTPASTITILLDGDDLALFGQNNSEVRYLTIEATYNSSLGNGLHLNDELAFSIAPLIGIENS